MVKINNLTDLKRFLSRKENLMLEDYNSNNNKIVIKFVYWPDKNDYPTGKMIEKIIQYIDNDKIDHWMVNITTTGISMDTFSLEFNLK